MTDPGELINGVYAYVATAPQPTLAITGLTGLITNVRFAWTHVSCGLCRRYIPLFTDGGSVETGIKVTRRTATWYTIYRPWGVPRVPDACPYRDCVAGSEHDRAGRGWLMDRSTLSPEPFRAEREIDTYRPWPASPRVLQLLNEVWAHLRATHPTLVAQADSRPIGRSGTRAGGR